MFCTECWEILTYERNLKHKIEKPDHVDKIITSIRFGTEGKFTALAYEYLKFKKEGDALFFENPYKHLTFEKATTPISIKKE